MNAKRLLSVFQVPALSNAGCLATLRRGLATASGRLQDIDSSKLTIQRSTIKRPKEVKEKLLFGKTFSDHMLEIDYGTEGWGQPKIVPYHKLELEPSSNCFHYGFECFEGLKAYNGPNKHPLLFRPMMNMKRLNESCERICLPTFNEAELLKCIKKLVMVDRDWLPEGEGYSLYIRPTVIGTDPYVGVSPPQHAKLFVITCPVGPYYKTGFKPVKLYADSTYCRAWPGGSGYTKIGANYAISVLPQKLSASKGYAQVLWLFGEEEKITEVGTMNQFFFWKKPNGQKELVTAPLDGTILPGVTRDSVLALTRKWGEFDVTERDYSIKEVVAAAKEGRLIEAFGTGTAAVISPVNGFFYRDQDYAVPLDPNDKSAGAGPLARRLLKDLLDIQYGKVSHEWADAITEQSWIRGGEF